MTREEITKILQDKDKTFIIISHRLDNMDLYNKVINKESEM